MVSHHVAIILVEMTTLKKFRRALEDLAHRVGLTHDHNRSKGTQVKSEDISVLACTTVKQL